MLRWGGAIAAVRPASRHVAAKAPARAPAAVVAEGPQGLDAAPRNVPALARGAAILDMVALAEEPQTLSTLARGLGLPKSTVHGLCSTLLNLGLLVRRSDGSFRVGPHVMRWANAFVASTDLTAEFASLWDELKVLPNGTITLSVLDGTDVVYIGCRNSGQPLGITFRIGMRLPAIYTATGKAFLSNMSEMRVRELARRSWPEPLTPRSVRNVTELLRELKTCRERGYSIDDGQTREGMYCFGTVVRDSSGQPVAGVAVSLLADDVNPGNMQLAADSIQVIARKLSIRMGADPGGEP